ncbi:hypothetical protein [Methanoculleus chikugoensis]|uniref:hypothetical protein n=1 Tax=Methanoculleus chikugoensis TaxID=118126 RepID=UPI000AD361BB|nr:hypothetical protein [Methanoculleus chikugoensis]
MLQKLPVLLGIFVVMALSNAVVPVLPDFAEGAALQGVVYSAYFLGAFLTVLPGGDCERPDWQRPPHPHRASPDSCKRRLYPALPFRPAAPRLPGGRGNRCRALSLGGARVGELAPVVRAAQRLRHGGPEPRSGRGGFSRRAGSMLSSTPILRGSPSLRCLPSPPRP